MKIAIISARYLEQHALEAFFGELFGVGQARVTFARGRFQCRLPRALSEAELESMKDAVDFTHYSSA